MPTITDQGVKTIRRPGVAGAVQVASTSASGTGAASTLSVPALISALEKSSVTGLVDRAERRGLV